MECLREGYLNLVPRYKSNATIYQKADIGVWSGKLDLWDSVFFSSRTSVSLCKQ